VRAPSTTEKEKKTMRKLVVTIVCALAVASAVALGPGGWYQRGAREVTARYHQAYVAATWPAEDAGIYVGGYIKAHNRNAGGGGFYSMPTGGQAQVAPRLVTWGDWTRDPARQYARIHRAGTDMALLRLSVMGELGGALLLVVLLLSRPLWYVTTGMAKLKPSKALGGAVLATWRDLRALKPTRRDAQIILGRLGRKVLALRGLEQYQSILVVGPPRAGKSVGLFITNLLAERGPGRGTGLIERLQRRQAALTTVAGRPVDGQGDGDTGGDGGRGRVERRLAVRALNRVERRLAVRALNRVERRLQRRRLHGVRSIVVTDLKGELTERTYAAMSRHHRCQVLNLVSPGTSVGYNPLAHITTALDAQVFAQTWIANTGQSSNEPFWDSAAKYLITAIVLHLNATQLGGATLTHVRKFLMLGSAKIMGALIDSPDADVKEAMDGFTTDLERNEKLQGSIFVELPLRFQLLADPRVQVTTGRNDVDFAAMASLDAEPVALYLVLDRRMSQELKPLTACFFTQMFNTVIEIADRSPGGMLPRSILGYLDEFGNLGQIYNFPTWMTTVRSAGMGFILAVQSLSQLKKLYDDEGMKIVLDACNVKIALAKTTDEDAKWFSEQTGTATALAANAGAIRGPARALAPGDARPGGRGVPAPGARRGRATAGTRPTGGPSRRRPPLRVRRSRGAAGRRDAGGAGGVPGQRQAGGRGPGVGRPAAPARRTGRARPLRAGPRVGRAAGATARAARQDGQDGQDGADEAGAGRDDVDARGRPHDRGGPGAARRHGRGAVRRRRVRPPERRHATAPGVDARAA